MLKNKIVKVILGIIIFILGTLDVFAVETNLTYNSSDKYLTMYYKADAFVNIYGAWADCYKDGNKNNKHFVLFWGEVWYKKLPVAPDKVLSLEEGGQTKKQYIGDWETGVYSCEAYVLDTLGQNYEGYFS